MRFKNLEGKPGRESAKRTIFPKMGLDRYKWYQSQTPGDVPERTLAPKGVDCESPHRLERRMKHFL